MAAYLQKGYIVLTTSLKDGFCFGIKTYDILTQQIINSFPGIFFTKNRLYFSTKKNPRKGGNKLFIEFTINLLHQNRCSIHNESCATA